MSDSEDEIKQAIPHSSPVRANTTHLFFSPSSIRGLIQLQPIPEPAVSHFEDDLRDCVSHSNE